MKNGLVATDDAHTAAWVRSGLAPLGVSLVECRLAELGTKLTGAEEDFVVLDGGRDPEVLVQTVEKAADSGSSLKLIVLVEANVLPSLRLPVRFPTDFMVRGGSSEELAARARLLLWPGEEVSDSELIRVDDLTVNLATYQAYWRSTPIDFTYLEYALFTFLITHPNRAYSREVLLRRVWGTDYYGGSRTVDVHIRRIRAKLPAEVAPRLDTVRNVGYLWRDED